MSGRFLSRIGVGTLLALSCLATAASLFGYASAPRWWVMIAFAPLAGLGAGAIDAGLNTYVATHHSARTLNWLHACYGVGTASGPMIMGAVLMAGRPWQRGYAIVAAAQLVLAACFALSRGWWPAAERRDAKAAARASAAETLRIPVVWMNLAAFFVYTGIEASFGAWSYSLLAEARGVATATAAWWVSAFWSGLTVGRIVFGFAAGRAPIDRMLRASIGSIALAAALVWADIGGISGFIGLALAGLACGPVFPSLIATTPARVGQAHTANAVGFQIAAAALGQSILPGLVGAAAAAAGLEIIGPLLLTASFLLFGAHAALASRRSGSASQAAAIAA
jgi:fucose permease